MQLQMCSNSAKKSDEAKHNAFSVYLLLLTYEREAYNF